MENTFVAIDLPICARPNPTRAPEPAPARAIDSERRTGQRPLSARFWRVQATTRTQTETGHVREALSGSDERATRKQKRRPLPPAPEAGVESRPSSRPERLPEAPGAPVLESEVAPAVTPPARELQPANVPLLDGPVAQLAEQQTLNLLVLGSTPSGLTSQNL